jgi:hypothetical protein
MRRGTSHVAVLFYLDLEFQESAMADKVPRGMSDKGTLRDPSKMVSNNQRWVYAAILAAVLGFVGFTVYSVTNDPNPTPPATTTP